MVDPRPIADKPAEPQIRLDQRRRARHRQPSVKRILRHQIHPQPVGAARPHPQRLGGQMVVMQKGQRLRQCHHVHAMETRRPEHHLDAALQHIVRQTVPQMKHCGPAAQVFVHARPPQFQQSAARSFQRLEVILALRVVPPGQRHPVAGQQAVDAHDILQPIGIPPAVDQQQMLEEGIERIPLQPRGVIDQRAIAAQFLDEHRIAQPLCRPQIAVVPGEAQGKGVVVGNHGIHGPSA